MGPLEGFYKGASFRCEEAVAVTAVHCEDGGWEAHVILRNAERITWTVRDQETAIAAVNSLTDLINKHERR